MENIFCKTGDYRRNGFFVGAPRFFVLLLLFGCCALVFSAPATAAEKPKTDKAVPVQTSATPAPPQPAQPSAPTMNSVTQAAVKAGVLSCSNRINQVMTYITANSQSGAYLFFPKTQPDQSIFSASIEVQSQKATPIYVSANFAPLTNGQAGAVYDAVEYVAQSCDYMEKIVFKDLKRGGILRKDIIMLDGGAVKIFLMPAGKNGCIVIKKEVVQ